MYQNIRSTIAAMVATVGLTVLGTATPARAGMVIQLSIDGVHWDTVASAGSGTATFYNDPNYHGFAISGLSEDSNSPGMPPPAYLEGSANHIKNNNAATATLYVKLSDTGFTMPAAPPGVTLDSQIGGSVVVPGAQNTLIYQSYVDPSNGTASQSGFTAGMQMPGITGTPSSYSDDTSMTITSGLSTTYSITESFVFTLSAGSQVGFESSTNLSGIGGSAVPEPSGLVLAGISVLGVAGYVRRRRRTASA